jgi:hypothetical protein
MSWEPPLISETPCWSFALRGSGGSQKLKNWRLMSGVWGGACPSPSDYGDWWSVVSFDSVSWRIVAIDLFDILDGYLRSKTDKKCRGPLDRFHVCKSGPSKYARCILMTEHSLCGPSVSQLARVTNWQGCKLYSLGAFAVEFNVALGIAQKLATGDRHWVTDDPPSHSSR